MYRSQLEGPPLNDYHDRSPARRVLQGIAGNGLDILDTQRAGDPERARYVEHLNRLHSLGYLSVADHDARVSAALRAPSLAVLNELIADLQGLAVPVSPISSEALLHPNRRSITLLIISSVLSVGTAVVPGAALLAANLARTPLWMAALGFLSLTTGLVWSVANATWWNHLWNNS